MAFLGLVEHIDGFQSFRWVLCSIFHGYLFFPKDHLWTKGKFRESPWDFLWLIVRPRVFLESSRVSEAPDVFRALSPIPLKWSIDWA